MITRHAQFQPKLLRNSFIRNVTSLFEKINQNVLRFLCERVSLWTRILKLFLKILVLQFKVAIFAQKRRVLLFQRRHLLREQRSLLVEKINHVFGKPDSAAEPDKFFGCVNGTHKQNLSVPLPIQSRKMKIST